MCKQSDCENVNEKVKVFISEPFMGHAEYPGVSIHHKLLSRTPPKTSPPNQCKLPHVQAANQTCCLPAHFKYTKANSQTVIVRH
jgi:hypothetical protein